MNIDFTSLDGFEWDLGNLEHIKKHKVSYQECEEVLFSKNIKIFDDNKHSIYEERFKIFGSSIKSRKLTLVATVRNNKLRIVMARDQNRKERGDLND